MMVAEPQSLISSLGDEKRDIRWPSRDLDPHPARLIRWPTVRPRCMSSVVQTLVAGTNTYLAWSKPFLPARSLPIAFKPMTSHWLSTSPLQARRGDYDACDSWCQFSGNPPNSTQIRV
jgi:hypothetical protein